MNHNQLPVNFYPNDRADQPRPNIAYAPPPSLPLDEAWVQAYDQDDKDYYTQAGNLYRILSNGEQERLAKRIAGGLALAESLVQRRMLDHLDRVDVDYGARVRDGIEDVKWRPPGSSVCERRGSP